MSARLLAGHRDHTISRPRLISDWAWSRGDDPVWILLALGGVVLFAGAILLLDARRTRKAVLSLTVLLFIGWLAWLYVEKDSPYIP